MIVICKSDACLCKLLVCLVDESDVLVVVFLTLPVCAGDDESVASDIKVILNGLINNVGCKSACACVCTDNGETVLVEPLLYVCCGVAEKSGKLNIFGSCLCNLFKGKAKICFRNVADTVHLNTVFYFAHNNSPFGFSNLYLWFMIAPLSAELTIMEYLLR